MPFRSMFSVIVLALTICFPATAQFTSPTVSLLFATANLTWYVATTGSDSNPCTSGSPCLTLQHVVNLAAGYDWNNKFYPTINVADGTYANTQVILPALINAPNNNQTNIASIIGNTTTPTNVVLQDAGTAYTFSVATASRWNIKGFSFGGTYGGIYAHGFSTLFINNLNWAGTLANLGLFLEPIAAVYANNDSTPGGTFTISASTMHGWIFSRGLIVFDNSTITVVNPITVSSFIALDASPSFFAFAGVTFVGGSNVTASSWGLIINNGPFFESGVGTTIDGVAVSRANFPGGVGGSKVLVDGWSTFQADLIAIYSGSGVAGIVDTTGVVRADYNSSSAGNWTYNVANGAFIITSANTANTGLELNNTSSGGHNSAFFNAGSAGILGLTVGQGGYFDITNGNPVFWYDTSANFILSGMLGFSIKNAFTSTAPTAGLSLTAAATVAVGNGTAGDFSGTIRATHFTSASTAGVSCSGTPTSSFASVNGIVTHC